MSARRIVPGVSAAGFEEACRRRGFAVTIQRQAVFEELARRHDHPTADQVYEALRPLYPALSRTTVYRVLETLVGAGLARKVQHASAVARFDARVARHHHLACDGCGALVDLDDAAVPALSLPSARRTGFRVRDYTVCFTGQCPRCSGSGRKERSA